MLATTSMRVPSSVTAGSCACARSSLRCVLRSLLRAADARDFFRRRIQAQRAFVAIENDGCAVRNFERGRFDAGERGNAQRTREDRDVRSRAAARRAKPITRVRSSAAVSEGVRSSAMRIVFGGYSGACRVRAGENREHAQTDIAHIVGALGEQSVAQRGEPSA